MLWMKENNEAFKFMEQIIVMAIVLLIVPSVDLKM